MLEQVKSKVHMFDTLQTMDDQKDDDDEAQQVERIFQEKVDDGCSARQGGSGGIMY